MRLTIDLPSKHRDILLPTHTTAGKRVRYRCLHGGRDSAKSHSVARMLLARGRAHREQILCVREVQQSIADSVHRLLGGLIQPLGMAGFYDLQQRYINGANGSQFAFHGLSSETAASLKSQEGTTICWIEEAQTISKRSWDILEPTIRAPDSEIWVTFNPDMDTDPMYRFFVAHPPDDALVARVNWQDNPWRSKVLDAARERMQREEPDNYMHVYEGHCRPAVEGAIYYKEVAKLRSEGRLTNVPYDPMLKVHIVTDLGFNDYMSLLLVQRLHSEIRIIRYIEDRQRYIPSYSQELCDLKLNFGKLYLPHDGKAKHLTGASAQEQFEALGWDVEIVPDVGVEQGIRKAREVFPRVAIDSAHAGELANRLGRYRRRVNSDGQASTPMHDDQSHGADGFRYLALVADQLTNESVALPSDPYASYRRAYG